MVAEDLHIRTSGRLNGATVGQESTEWELVVTGRPGRPRIHTLVADHDPISRRVINGVLDSSDQIDVVACVDSHDPLPQWPLRQVDVAVLGLTPGDFLVDVVRELASRLIRVVLIGVDWSRCGLDEAVAAGATGCLVKDPELRGMVGSVCAVAGGNVVLSPQLLELYLPRLSPGAARQRESLEAVLRLSERERQVLTMLGEGMSTAETAKRCGVSTATIKSHVSHALIKLGARNRLEAVLMVRGALVSAR